jgi:hypothetical protein
LDWLFHIPQTRMPVPPFLPAQSRYYATIMYTILRVFSHYLADIFLYISLLRAFIDIDIMHMITLLFSHAFPELPSLAMKVIQTICTKGHFRAMRQLSALSFPCRGKPRLQLSSFFLLPVPFVFLNKSGCINTFDRVLA